MGVSREIKACVIYGRWGRSAFPQSEPQSFFQKQHLSEVAKVLS